MKTNKAFTVIELLVVIVIIAIVLSMVAQFFNIFNFLFWVLAYFSIPAIILGGLLKLNQKYKWLVKKWHSKTLYDYKLKNGGTINGESIDGDIVKINMIAFTIIWPIYLPGIVAFVGGKEVYHRYLKNNFSIPEDKQ